MLPWRNIATRRPADPSITPLKIGAGPIGATGPVPPRTGPLPVGGSNAANSTGGEKMSRVGAVALAAPLGNNGAAAFAAGAVACGAGLTGGGNVAGICGSRPNSSNVARLKATANNPMRI